MYLQKSLTLLFMKTVLNIHLLSQQCVLKAITYWKEYQIDFIIAWLTILCVLWVTKNRPNQLPEKSENSLVTNFTEFTVMISTHVVILWQQEENYTLQFCFYYRYPMKAISVVLFPSFNVL